MANIKRANTSGITKTGTAVADVPDAPTIGVATAAGLAASVTFTQAVTGGTPTSFTVTSSPGGFTGTGASAPITVSGLTDATSYTFTVTATNAAGTSTASSASNSITAVLPMEGAYDSLATVTLSATATSVTFAGIPSGYKHLQIREISQINVAGASKDVYMRFNSDTAANYSMHVLYGNGTSAIETASTSATYAELATTGTTAGASVFSGGVIDILDYADTNKYKTTRSITSWDGNGTGVVFFYSGNWRSTSAVSTITLTASTGSFTANSSFALFGVK